MKNDFGERDIDFEVYLEKSSERNGSGIRRRCTLSEKKKT